MWQEMTTFSTEIAPTRDMLYEATEKADKAMHVAAGRLAYDLTFRADDEYVGQHDRPNAQLTAKLKAEYRAAHEAARAAWVAVENADSL